MDVSSVNSPPNTLGQHIQIGRYIRKMRQARGLTQEALASPEFTKGYVSALERGAVRPSLKALEVFARRLEVPITDLLGAKHEIENEPELRALKEDLNYQFNYAKMLIRTDRVIEAFDLINNIEDNMQPHNEKLPESLRYMPSFLRGRAYVQQSRPELARPELERALDLARTDEEARARTHNLLGVVLQHQEQPQLALQQHLLCLQAITNSVIKDPNFRVSVYHNLANSYWASGDPDQAIGVYKEALVVLRDLNDYNAQAEVYWGLANAYKATDDWPQAKLYATRALHIYEAEDNKVAAATMSINLAELLMGDSQYEAAQDALKHAEEFLAGTSEQVLLGNLYYDYADLARRLGQLDQASELIAKSMMLLEHGINGEIRAGEGAEEDEAAEKADQLGEFDHPAQVQMQTSTASRAWAARMRTYVEALHIAAVIEDEMANMDAADNLFQRALDYARRIGYEEIIYSISLSYGTVLKKRGDFERAVEYLESAAQGRGKRARRHNL
jgi:tetratricopeptide (TPR) repeat protein